MGVQWELWVWGGVGAPWVWVGAPQVCDGTYRCGVGWAPCGCQVGTPWVGVGGP